MFIVLLLVIAVLFMNLELALAEPPGYRNYEQISADLAKFAQDHSTRTHLYSIGKSVENRDLWVLAIANAKPNEHVKLRPEIKFIGSTSIYI